MAARLMSGRTAYLRAVYRCQILNPDFEGYFGKIHAVAIRPAPSRQEQQVDVHVIAEKVETAGEVQFVVVSELVIDMVVNGQNYQKAVHRYESVSHHRTF
jgi:hypothetical protein